MIISSIIKSIQKLGNTNEIKKTLNTTEHACSTNIYEWVLRFYLLEENIFLYFYQSKDTLLRKKGGTGSDEKLVNNAVNNILKKSETYILHI